MYKSEYSKTAYLSNPENIHNLRTQTILMLNLNFSTVHWRCWCEKCILCLPLLLLLMLCYVVLSESNKVIHKLPLDIFKFCWSSYITSVLFAVFWESSRSSSSHLHLVLQLIRCKYSKKHLSKTSTWNVIENIETIN